MLRSARQRRRAFEVEAQPIIRKFEASYPKVEKPQTVSERDALYASHSDFAVFCDALDALARKWDV